MRDNENKSETINLEEFALLRKNAFYDAFALLLVLVVAIFLFVVMLLNHVDSRNIYIFQFIGFSVCVIGLGKVQQSFAKVSHIQKEYPKYLQETSWRKNKTKLPRQWNIRRLKMTSLALVIVCSTCFVLLEPQEINTNTNSALNVQERIPQKNLNEYLEGIEMSDDE